MCFQQINKAFGSTHGYIRKMCAAVLLGYLPSTIWANKQHTYMSKLVAFWDLLQFLGARGMELKERACDWEVTVNF